MSAHVLVEKAANSPKIATPQSLGLPASGVFTRQRGRHVLIREIVFAPLLANVRNDQEQGSHGDVAYADLKK